METKRILRTTVDLPIELNEKLKAEATPNKRSRHAQIIYILEIFFAEKSKEVKKK